MSTRKMQFTSGRLSTLVLVCAFSSQAAWASTIAYEGFSPSFPIYANGGTGFNGAWFQGGTNVSASRYAQNVDGLCFSRLTTSGGSVSGVTAQELNGAVRNLARPLGDTVYLSFVLRPHEPLNEGLFGGFFGITLNGSLNRLFIGKPGGGATGQYVLETQGGGGQFPSGVQVSTHRTALLVVKAQFLPGRDIFTLNVDPKPGRPEPAGGVMKADLDIGTVSQIGIFSTGAFSVDELRIGTSFADVVPAGRDSSHDESPGCDEDR